MKWRIPGTVLQIHVRAVWDERETAVCHGELSFDFAVPIDPASVTSESIYVNDEPLPADIKIYFNRRGDEMKIREPIQWRGKVIRLEIKKLRSVTGEDISPPMVFHLGPDEEIEMDDFDWYDD